MKTLFGEGDGVGYFYRVRDVYGMRYFYRTRYGDRACQCDGTADVCHAADIYRMPYRYCLTNIHERKEFSGTVEVDDVTDFYDVPDIHDMPDVYGMSDVYGVSEVNGIAYADGITD